MKLSLLLNDSSTVGNILLKACHFLSTHYYRNTLWSAQDFSGAGGFPIWGFDPALFESQR